MRIVQVVPGSGDNFYCENCLRDIALVKAIHKLGHDVLMVPLYLLIGLDGSDDVSSAPIFFGGVNVYLQQKSALFRKTPRWVDRLFDLPGLLKWVGRRAGMTSARDLGQATISMLRAEQGRQVKELERFVEWLSTSENRPDIVCLSNVLLAGLARRIKEKVGVPVLCLLQDEDGFLDGFEPPYAQQAWEVAAERSNDIDGFISVSKYCADVMQKRLRISEDRMYVVYMGILLDGYEPAQSMPAVPTIGYLSRMCPDKGLDTLVEAFAIVKTNPRLGSTKLRVAGGKTGYDEVFVSGIKQTLSSRNLTPDVEFLPDFDRDARLAFLKTISVLSVPEKRPVSCGLYVLEALAAGVPVVQPEIGCFGELLEMTEGGILYEPGNVKMLAAAIEKLLIDPDYAFELGRRGRQGVSEKLTVEQTAKDIVNIYQETLERFA